MNLNKRYAACAALALLAVPAAGVRLLAAPSRTAQLKKIRLTDGAGRAHTLAEYGKSRILVLLFVGAFCPISNSYAGPVSTLSGEYAGRGVQFVGVNSMLAESPETVAAHAREYRMAFPVLKDGGQELADLLGARVTPEVFVLDQNRRVRYQGRIDDRYSSRTRQSARVTNHDLRSALDALLAGRAPDAPSTRAFGCAISRPQKQVSNAEVTFHRDVEPVLQKRCQSCHRPGQVAPFSLLTYADAQSWAPEIAEFAAARRMPPWKAEPGFGHFRESRRLSDQEIHLLKRWAELGAPRGNESDAPPARQWPEGWMLGKPDLVLEPSESFDVAAEGDDVFRCFVLPTGLDRDVDVAAVEIRPGSPRVVHHVINFLDSSGNGRKLDEKDAGPGYNGGPGGVGFLPSGGLGGWAPGNMPRFLPEGIGMKLRKGADVVMQVHYHKTGKPERDRTRVGLYFARKPVERYMSMIPVTDLRIDIPPGVERHEVKSDIRVPFQAEVLSVTPHMHLLGKEMKVWATLPDQSEQNLIWIKDWDYRWQDTYYFEKPLSLPAGSTVHMRAYFDNSDSNPLNPHSPPKRVTFGESTTDEMAFAFLEYVKSGTAGPEGRGGLLGFLLQGLGGGTPPGRPAPRPAP